MGYRDEREAAQARVKSLEKELDEARGTLRQLEDKDKEKERDKPTPTKTEPSVAAKLFARVKLIGIAGLAITAGAIFIGWCNSSAERGLDSTRGKLVHIEELGERSALVISAQHYYDHGPFDCNNKGHRNDLRVSHLDLRTGEVTHSARLHGGDGQKGVNPTTKFVGRDDSKLWFVDSARGLHARDLTGAVVTDKSLFAGVPGGAGLPHVLSEDGMYAAGDDGYWYRLGAGDGEQHRVTTKPRARSLGKFYPNPTPCTDMQPRIESEPNTPRSHVVFDGEVVPNTASLEVRLVMDDRCALILEDPRSVVIRSKERLRGPESTRRVSLDGEVLWSFEAKVERLTVLPDMTDAGALLLERTTTNKPIVFRARSAATGRVVWETELR